MAASLVITIRADRSKVDTWSVAPTVLLSVCAAVSTMMVRAAFRSAIDIFWWSSVCSKRGVDMEELHAIWDIGYNPRSLAAPSSFKASLQPLLRSTASLVLLMAAVGPLLQRAITIGLDTESTAWTGSIPIRREPMWNLTTQGGLNGGFDWNAQPYEGTFAQVADELQQRQPIVLPRSSELCPDNSTCTTSVTVAGFRRSCTESSMPSANITSLKPARRLAIVNANDHYCPSTGSHADRVYEGDLYCTVLETRFQLEFMQIYPPNTDHADGSDPQYDNPEDLGLDQRLPPTVLGYRSYIRRDIDTDTISVRDCNFATAFVTLPIQVTSRNVVTLLSSHTGPQNGSIDPSNLREDRHTIELIPSPFLWSPNSAILDGVGQLMTDLYGGATFLDTNEGTQLIQGIGARQFINQSSIMTRTNFNNTRGGALRGTDLAYNDPLDAFTDTLEEISLRYAVKSLATDQESRDKLENYIHPPNMPTDEFRSDNRSAAAESMKTTISSQQNVTVDQSTIVAIYKVNYVYTVIAVGCVYLEVLLTLALLRSWKRLGREFSMSPLEIAKAFNAPILEHVNSNSTGVQISRDLPRMVVRYGESNEAPAIRRGTIRRKPVAKTKSTGIDGGETANLTVNSDIATGSRETRKLLIGPLDQVSTPVKCRKTSYD